MEAKKTWTFCVLGGILILHSVAILLFTKGFLLTRTELSYYSQCSDILQSPCVPSPAESSEENISDYLKSYLNNTHEERGCWTNPAVDRIVIILLDALRFDFVAPSTFFEVKKPWMDKLQVLHKLASEPGSSARIFKSVADPPTTSLQRLKGLTTGGLPTFIDVGNSFGAPAITEDNFIYQLAQRGKRVLMMGDDTWVQLFPNHFNRSYPFPSFNVKDLHTVDNGCIKHLFPSLYEDNWDVLIAHFLGVDHAGHISSVDSIPMIEKLEQYNGILERVVEALESQREPGGLHENTLLLVMGDHGQTINGDHGGGSAEEVETAIFALSMKKPPSSVPLELDTSSCQQDLEGREICISSIQQLDFAATVSALLGLPFPFGSIGRVNSELYGLVADTWNPEKCEVGNCQSRSNLELWLQNYVHVLCINSWQVKKYIDVYSASSVIGFSNEDLLHVSDTYAGAQRNWSNEMKYSMLYGNNSSSTLAPAFEKQIKAYSEFLEKVAELARSKWTEFDLKMMGIGFYIMLVSLLVHFMCIKKVEKLCGVPFYSVGKCRISVGVIVAYIIVVIRSCSFLSNSYILQEGKVASFLLATIGILYFRYSVMEKKMLFEVLVFVLLIPVLRFTIELGLSKQAVTSLFLTISPPWMLGIAEESPLLVYIRELVPILALIPLAYILYKSINWSSSKRSLKFAISGTIFSYALIAVYWALESKLFRVPLVLEGIQGNVIPRIIYYVGLLQLSLLIVVRLFNERIKSDWEACVTPKAVAMLSVWSSTVILLSGKQGSLVALASIIGGWCIMRLASLERNDITAMFYYSSPVTQWSLLAVCLFFCTGHWCAFDGLRYAAAFIGFDEFNLFRQAILLTIDTFGFSHILPIFGLPLLVSCQYQCWSRTEERKEFFMMKLFLVYLIYGLVTATTVTFTILCVIIQRRHLMVWGLFAPKFVFDVVALLLTDVLIFLASVFYFD